MQKLGLCTGTEFYLTQNKLCIVAYVIVMAIYHSPVPAAEVIRLASSLAGMREGWNGYPWYHRFLKRNAQLMKRHKPKSLGSKRLGPTIVENTQAFVRFYEQWRESHAVPPRWVINADESGLGVSEEQILRGRIEASRKHKATFDLKKSGMFVVLSSCMFLILVAS